MDHIGLKLDRIGLKLDQKVLKIDCNGMCVKYLGQLECDAKT